jgi:hypothetical protein
VSASSTILGASAALVFGAGVYLFHEVNAKPAAVDAPAVVAHTPSPPVAPPPVADTPSPPPHHHVEPPPPPADGEAAPHPNKRSLGHLMKGPPEDLSAGSDDPRVPPEMRAHVEQDAIMDQANKAYDTGEMEDAIAIAGKVLAKDPNNIRMQRIMVSAACQMGDSATAQKYYAQLPPADRNQMKVRCARYGMAFE